MDSYRHHVSGFFVHSEEAEHALVRQAGLGLPSTRLHPLDADSLSRPPAPASAASSASSALIRASQ